MKTAPFVRALLFGLAAVVVAGPAFAQTTGTIRGTVKDLSGAVVIGAKLTVTSEATGLARSTTSDTSGDYEFAVLPVGLYTLEAEFTGFKKYVRKGIDVTIGHVVVINPLLEVGSSAQTVTVEAAALQVETTSTQLGAVMNDLAVRELPLNLRDSYQLLQLQPGVMSQLGSNGTLFYGSDQAGAVSVNGGRGRANNFMVNGGDSNDVFVNLPTVQPAPDSIQEFRVLTNTFDAEYGRNSGAIVNVVTKSGTNQFHGDFYEYFRNKALNARGFLDTTKPDFKQNQFGATLGGPIKKDRTFFFASYEGRRIRQGISSDVITVPTPQEHMGDFSFGGTAGAFAGTLTDDTVASVLNSRSTCASDVAAEGGAPIAAGTPYASIFFNNQIPASCFDPTALDLLNQFVPTPNIPGTSNFQTVVTSRTRGDQFTVRADHSISKTQQLSAYYYFDDSNFFQPFSFFEAAGANLPGFGSLYFTRNQQVNVSHTWTIGSSAVNEFRFTYMREGQGQFNHPQHTNLVQNSCVTVPASQCFSDPSNPRLGITPNLGAGREGVPFISVSGGFAIGNNFEGELPQIGNSFQWSDGYSRIIGKHSLKFGGDVRYQRFDQTLFFDVGGLFGYTGGGPNDVGFSDLFPNYLLGLPDSYGQGSAQVELVRDYAVYLFGQDSWKIRPNLTLNYGLRYELTPPLWDAGQKVQTFRQGQATTIYPCTIGPNGSQLTGFPVGTSCDPGGPAQAVFPLGEVIPGDTGVPKGLTQTYKQGFAPRIGLAWSPGWSNGLLSKLTGGPGNTSIRIGWGIFYNPIEQLVLEQFSAEPPFGGSTFISETLFNTPFEFQNGSIAPNPFNGILSPPRGQPVDWSTFRPILLFGEFQPKMRSQYSEQYNLSIQRQLGRNMLFEIGYVGTQSHRLLASHDLNFGNAQTCLDLERLFETGNPAYASLSCGPFFADSSFGFVLQPGDTLTLPSRKAVTGGVNGTPIALVGLRPFSSPLCDPLNGFDPSTGSFINGCPPDGIPVFSSIFAQDTIGNSTYNSLQLLFDRNFSKGLQFRAAYTFSKSIDDASSFENILNPIDFRRSRSLSLFDARHRFVFSYYWEFPIPHHTGLVGKLLDGWGSSGIVTFQSGFPVRINSGDDIELGTSFDFEPVGEPDLLAHFVTGDPRHSGCAIGTGPNAGPNNPNAPGPPPPCQMIPNQVFDPNLFSNNTVRLGTFGNSPRTVCCGPGINQFDITILKTTKISESKRVEFRTDFFNSFNHAQFFNPDGNISDGADFGRTKRVRDPRLIQFALKFYF